MSAPETKEVFVLADFTDKAGTERSKGDVFTVAYATDRQRQSVNEMVHRGFLSFDVKGMQRRVSKPGA